MPTSLRAFLMVRTAVNGWNIEVLHSLEDVVRAWGQCDDDLKTAILHVGFERRVAKNFEDLAREFPGKVLLTPGAKGALPQAFETSKNPIGSIEHEPIYLALEGWGYSESEPLGLASLSPVASFKGWLGAFVSKYSDQKGILASSGIVDDSSYLASEDALQHELRVHLGIFRSAYLVGDAREDPTALARAAPPWLSSRDLSELNLTVRIGNVFRQRSINQVSDLGDLTISELLTFPNFGRTSIHHLVGILCDALAEGPRGLDSDDLRSTAGNLLQSVQSSLDACSDRERDILVRRMGFQCVPETLAEIGDSYGVTRERIRQIEAKVVDRLVRQEVWDDVLAVKLQTLLADREFPLPLIGAEALDTWFSGVAAQRDAIRYLIANMCNARVSLVEIDGVEYLTFLSQEDWDGLVSTARQLLASGVDQRWSEEECRHYVKLLVPDDAREFVSLLWDISSKWCHFADNDNVRSLISYGRGVDQIVEAVLLDSDVPLHYSDIAIEASVRSGRDLDERRVHNAAAEVGYLFGPGTYGMLKHVTVPREEWESFADEAAEIVGEAAVDRQWHASELISRLIDRGVSVPSSFDKYQMDIALKQDGQLHSLGRMVWATSEAAIARVDIRQAVIAILQSAGEPITSAELRQRLIAVRGINEGMQFQVIDPLIKLDSQTWGLNDRDISIKRSEQPAFLDTIVSKLRSRMRPIHISESAEIVGSVIPARVLFCLASLDARLRVTPDRNLTLHEWSSTLDNNR